MTESSLGRSPAGQLKPTAKCLTPSSSGSSLLKRTRGVKPQLNTGKARLHWRFARRFRPAFSPLLSIFLLHRHLIAIIRYLGRSVLKNRTFSIFQTAKSQGTVKEIRCQRLKYSWYLWRKRLPFSSGQDANVN